ncbi:hypothetical protein CDAR_473361 [Caerostris darwini]|uniref:Uncharacterized protein n=1 Tax=Caerostris darwini TaxID=1538125 RepID=A0AAV4TUT4_9ARAC|nr:hypothetical protein CDAR_473361 [Caerostris darwini]
MCMRGADCEMSRSGEGVINFGSPPKVRREVLLGEKIRETTVNQAALAATRLGLQLRGDLSMSKEKFSFHETTSFYSSFNPCRKRVEVEMKINNN